MKRVGIIGGGIIGLSCAYYLNKAGFRVSVFDQGDFTEGCSIGNAGMIVPSHLTPLASPGMIAKGVRWMFNSSSPFYVKPRFSKGLLKWGYQFYRHSTLDHVEKSSSALKEVSFLSKAMYQDWNKELPFDFGFQERGLLMLYQTPTAEKETAEEAHLANKTGVEANILSPTQVQALEPDVRVSVRGGVFYPGDAHLIPHVLVRELVSHLKEKGVTFLPGITVDEFLTEKNSVRMLRSNLGEFEIDELVVAAGSWSGDLISKLGISLPMQAGKGYSFTLDEVTKNIRIPSILLEGRVAVTPMENSLRFGGTMEISGIDHSINMKRVRGIVDTIPSFYPDMKIAVPPTGKVWHGLRPCSPDGLPYIGRTSKFTNVIIATGHSMMGLSLGPGTGKLVSELAMNEKTSIPLHAFAPERYDD